MKQSYLSHILLVILFTLRIVIAQQVFSFKGCYSQSDVNSLSLESQGSYTYQSPSYCQGLCSEYQFYALMDGGDCYCGNSLKKLLTLKTVDSSECSTNCNGWPDDKCGGPSAMDVYGNDEALIASDTDSSSSSSSSSSTASSSSSSSTASSSSSSSTASSSSSSSAATSSSTSTSTSTSKSTTYMSSTQASSSKSSSSYSSSSSSHSSSSSSSSSTISSSNSASSSDSSSSHTPTTILTSLEYTTRIVTKSVVSAPNQTPGTIYVTTTSLVQTVTPTAVVLNSKNSSGSKGSSISGGAIAGIVIGVVFGTFFLILAIYFCFFRRNNRKNNEPDLEETKHYQPYSFGDENATPIILPPSSSTSNWRIPSRHNTTATNSRTNTNSSFSNFSKNGVEMLDATSTPTIINRTSMQNLTPKIKHPSTVFEEPIPFVDAGNQRFSTSSLPDMMEERPPLRIVNPDDNNSLAKHDTNKLEQFISSNDNNFNLDDSYVDLSRSSDDQSYNEKMSHSSR